MTTPINVDIPHKLGAEEAKRRMQNGMGRLADHLPAGAKVTTGWTGDRMNLGVQMMNQNVTATLDVEEQLVRVEVRVPAALSMFAKPIAALLKSKAGKMLEDKSSKD